MKKSEATKGKWLLEMSDLTIRCKNFDTSNLMGDNKGNIIADLKPSLGINDEDVYDGAILSYLDGKGVRQHAFREVLDNAKLICDLVNEINLSEIEPDNEKPYLFYEGDKYYFGEEYEFSDHEFERYEGVLRGYISNHNHPFKTNKDEYRRIHKIDHTSKYKKKLKELKQQAEKDGVNLKELI